MSRLPFDLAIAKPCQQPWQEMHGTGTQRQCDSCNKTVHNLATLTPRQIERLIHDSDGNVCARISRRQDGTLVTLNEHSRPYGALFTLSAVLAAAAPAFAQATSPTTLTAVQTARPLHPSHATVSGTITDADGALIVGAIVTVLDQTEAVASTSTDDRGEFHVSVHPGEYQLHVMARSFSPSTTKLAVTNTDSWIGPLVLRIGVSASVTVTTTQSDYTNMGALATTLTRRQRIAYRLRHPVAYIKYITHPR